MSSRRPILLAIIALAPFLMAAMYWWAHPQIAIDADTPRYVAGDPMRTATYPMFLRLANGPALLPLQLALFAAALAWLAVYVSKILPLSWTTIIVLVIATNPYVWELQATILSESLTTPLLTLFVGCMLGYAMTGRSLPLFAAVLICGVATTVRPPLAFLVFGPAILVCLTPKSQNKLKLLLLATILFAVPITAERAYSRRLYGVELHSPIGLLLFMKSAVIEAPPTRLAVQDPFELRAAQFLNEDYTPVRALIRKTKDFNIRYVLLSSYESCAAYSCGETFFKDFPMKEGEKYRKLGEVGVSRLMSNPAAYAELTVSEYLRMFLLFPRKEPALARHYNEFLAQNSPLPFQPLLSEYGKPTPEVEQKPIYYFIRFAFTMIGVMAMLMTLIFSFRRPGPFTLASFGVLVSAETVLVTHALAGLGQPRYSMGVWPILIGGILLGAVGLREWRGASLSAPCNSVAA